MNLNEVLKNFELAESNLKKLEQVWELIKELIATDAVQCIEKRNGGYNSLRIKRWSNSHLERLLAAHPRLIAEFGLRK